MAMQHSTGRPITDQSAASRDRNCEMLHIFSEPESLINVSPKVSIPPLRISAISVWLCQPVYFMRPKLFSARRSKWLYLRGRRKMKIFLFNYRARRTFQRSESPKTQRALEKNLNSFLYWLFYHVREGLAFASFPPCIFPFLFVRSVSFSNAMSKQSH